jgi:hypothetical protein
MLLNLTTVAASILSSVAPFNSQMTSMNYKVQDVTNFTTVNVEQTKDIALLNIEQPKEKRLICNGCSEQENATLAHFQNHGITDKNALATIMGNIRQESMFISNICEGGQRTSYKGCTRGGYGLIQFTSSSRYDGLGNYAQKTGGNPSSLETQLGYIVTEPEWKDIEHKLKTPGKPISQYMKYAYRWLGWGIHGARTNYAHEYVNKLVYENI